MSGSYGSPYRVPCGGVSWPAQEWFLGGFWQHKKDSESAIGKYVNSTVVPEWRCDPLTGLPYSRNIEPYPRRFTDTGFCPPDNCTGAVCTIPCAPWSQLNAPAAGSYDHNSYTADAEHPIDFSLCRKIGFKNVQAARIWHGCLGWLDGSCPIIQEGCACESVTPEESTFPQTKYLTKDAQCTLRSRYTFGYAGVLGCESDITGSVDGHSHRAYSVASNTGLISESTCTDAYYSEYSNSCTPPTTFSGIYAPLGSVLTWSAIAVKDATKISASCGRISVPADTFFAGLSGMTASEVQDYFNVVENTSGSDTEHTWTHARTLSAVASVTNTVISIVISERIVDTTTSLNPPYEVLTSDMTNTVTISVTLGGTNDFEDVQTDCLTLLDQWNLTDDIKYPWRTDDYCTVAPLVTRREVKGPVSPNIWSECGYVDPNSTDTSLLDPYDGSIKGAPLSQGYGHHFDFGHVTWDQCLDISSSYVPYRSTQGAWAGGHDPADPLLGDATDAGIPICATQWTENYSGSLDWIPSPGVMPAGAWVYNFAGTVVAQKWAETRVPRPSMNFARPCGPDRDRLDEETVRCIRGVVGTTVEIESATEISTGDTVYLCSASPLDDGFYTVSKTDDTHYVCTAKPNWPGTSDEIINCGTGILGKVRYPTAPGLCGRVELTSCVQDGSEVVVTLSTPAPQLRAGDLVDFTSVAGLGSSVSISSVTSDTVFRVVGTLTASPTLLGYLSCTGSASYEWDDTLWKGEYLWATWSHNYRDYQERDRVIQQSIDCAGCPDVPAPGAAIRTAQASYIPRSVDGMLFGQGCAPWSVCQPFVLCFSSSTSDDWGDHGDTIALGSTTGDDEYGDFWQGAYIQHVGDPFWQTPHPPCEGDPPSGRVAWSMDSGLCTGDYAQRPWVEARDGSPSGAPSFPSGISFHVVTLAELQTGSPPDGFVLAPPTGLGNVHGSSPIEPVKAFTPWGLYIAEESCVCSTGAFSTQYTENGVSCPTL